MAQSTGQPFGLSVLIRTFIS